MFIVAVESGSGLGGFSALPPVPQHVRGVRVPPFYRLETTAGRVGAFLGTYGWREEGEVNLQCYSRQCGSQAFAICTDLDIAVDGSSLAEARASLVTCVELYLERAEALYAKDRHRWLTRRAPWHVRAHMALLNALHRLRRGRGAPLSFVLESNELAVGHVQLG